MAILMEHLYASYTVFCREHHITPIGMRAFNKRFKESNPNATLRRTSAIIDGKKVNLEIWEGIYFRIKKQTKLTEETSVEKARKEAEEKAFREKCLKESREMAEKGFEGYIERTGAWAGVPRDTAWREIMKRREKSAQDVCRETAKTSYIT